MPSLSFRAPGVVLSLDQLLGRALPGSGASDREALVRRGVVEVAGLPARKLREGVESGRSIQVRDVAPPRASGLPFPLHVLIPVLPWKSGVLARRRGCASAVAFETVRESAPIAELRITPFGDAPEAAAVVFDPARFIDDALRILAEAGVPVLGDVRSGGVMVSGGLRVASAANQLGADWWPVEPVFAGWEEGAPAPSFSVSAATSRILQRGHPWVLRDDDTGDPSAFAAGTRVDLVDPTDRRLASAHIEGPGRLTARVWSRAGDARRGGVRDRDSVEARVAKAVERRRKLLESPDTDAFRVLHGEADGLPGLFADRLGGVLRVLVNSPGTDSYKTRAIDALVARLEGGLSSAPTVVEVTHLRDRPPGELVCTRVIRGDAPDSASIVRERGVRFRVELGLASPERSSPGVGLYLDQRENRARLVGKGRGRLLNLFAHTGAFSVAWLAAGRGTAVSVDLSAAYLRWLEENLALNGIDARLHESVKQDGRRYLESLAKHERFDAIVLDPPTAAAAGRRFWSVTRELPPLIEQALACLAPGGRLLVSRNDRRRAGLAELVRRAADARGVSLTGVHPAPAGADFPLLPEFPEGDPFAAVIATRR